MIKMPKYIPILLFVLMPILASISVSLAGFVFFAVFFYLMIKFTIKNPQMNSFKKSASTDTSANLNGVSLKCAKCGSDLKITDKFCGNCGEAFDGNNAKVELDSNASQNLQEVKTVSSLDFDPIFALKENEMIESYLKNEMKKAKIDENTKLIPSEVLKRKKVFNLVFSILLFIYVSLIFFHFPLITYIIGLVVLFVLYKSTRKYDLIKYLVKEIKSRPSEKISNIVMKTRESLVKNNSKILFSVTNILASIIPLLIFINPIIFYEEDPNNNGYAVRFYAFGITNFKSATIPMRHNNRNVVSLRGNTFSNMPFLEEVNLPDTIYEIRGQAFKNDFNLKRVKIPRRLNYLGGGAFYNCRSLTSIDLPDTLTYIGGESFKNATSLRQVKLPKHLEEIRGNTFENCKSLLEIAIPDSVTRIGGHAFYGNLSLKKVILTPNNNLDEIGSSAFRRCRNLNEITISKNTYVNSRAFKESPTQIYYFEHNYNFMPEYNY